MSGEREDGGLQITMEDNSEVTKRKKWVAGMAPCTGSYLELTEKMARLRLVCIKKTRRALRS